MRAAVLLAVLTPLIARAHTFAFDFVTPSGIGTRTDAGFTAVQWVDGPDPNGLAELALYASRNGISPFVPAAKDVQFGPLAIALNDPANVVIWDARAVPPGCYQPFAVITDQIAVAFRALPCCSCSRPSRWPTASGRGGDSCRTATIC